MCNCVFFAVEVLFHDDDGDRVFGTAAARICNSLPPTVTSTATLNSFKKTSENHLFHCFYPSLWLLTGLRLRLLRVLAAISLPHYRAVSISTPVHSVILGLPCRSLWPQLRAHLWYNPDWTTPTPLCVECQHLTCTNNSPLRILLLVWFCLLFAIFQQVSDLVTSTGFLSTTEYSSNRPYTYLYNIGNLSAILSLQSPLTTPATTSSPFLKPETIPSTIYVTSTDFGRRFFSYSSPATWNSIPTSIKNCPSLYSFKRHLKSHLTVQLINN